jgi:hypothetical protein
MTARRPFLAASLVALSLACASAPDGAVTRCEASQVIPAAVKTDILFVIDDSGSMSQEQANLATELDGFIQALASAPIANEFQIGVTNTSVEGAPNSSGVTQKSYGTGSPSSGVPYPAGALVAIARDSFGTVVPGKLVWTQGVGFGGTRILTAGSLTLVADFTANVLVGTNGSSKEQPFRAARLAVTDRIADGTNAGFLRPGARLAIVFLSDEDDCSDSAAPFATDQQCSDPAWKTGDLDSVDELASFLRGDIAGEPRDVVVAAIAGVNPTTLAPSCGTTSGSIICADQTCGTAWDEGDRFVKLTSALGSAHTRVASICDGGGPTSPGFGHALEDIAGLLVSQSMPLDAVPADWHMLVAGVERDGQTIPCPIQLDGTPEAATAAAVLTQPQEGKATLTFQGACQLKQGDVIKLDVVCAG